MIVQRADPCLESSQQGLRLCHCGTVAVSLSGHTVTTWDTGRSAAEGMADILAPSHLASKGGRKKCGLVESVAIVLSVSDESRTGRAL